MRRRLCDKLEYIQQTAESIFFLFLKNIDCSSIDIFVRNNKCSDGNCIEFCCYGRNNRYRRLNRVYLLLIQLDYSRSNFQVSSVTHIGNQ